MKIHKSTLIQKNQIFVCIFFLLLECIHCITYLPLLYFQAGIRCIDFHPYGDFLSSGSGDTNLKLWDIRRKGCIFTYKGHRYYILLQLNKPCEYRIFVFLGKISYIYSTVLKNIRFVALKEKEYFGNFDDFNKF